MDLFFKTEEIKDEFKAKGLKEAKQALDIFKLPREEQLEYQRWVENERYAKSMVVGNYQDGLMDGEANKEQYGDEKVKQIAYEIAKTLKKNGVPFDIIIQSTGLSEDEIKGIEV